VVRTLSRADFDKDRQVACGYTRADRVANRLTVRYAKNNGPTASSSPWQASVVVADVRSFEDTIDDTVDLRYVRSAVHAASVGGLVLKQRRRSFKTISLPVFWDATDLQIGDTITITDLGFWEGVNFWIDGVRREGVNRATFDAVEWWT
jgi:hypothetical protein